MDENELLELSGTVDSVIYKNEENGYTVLRLRDENGEGVTVVGCFPYAAPGESMIVSGNWVSHSVHGRQFKAEFSQRMLPSTAPAIYEYLAGGAVRGIGPATAALIVNKFGDKTLDVLENAPQKLAEIKRHKRGEGGAAFRRASASRLGYADSWSSLCSFGLRPILAMRMYKYLRRRGAMELLRENPYILASVHIGGSFAEADRLALEMGIDGYSANRICAAIIFELQHNSGNGHCFIPREQARRGDGEAHRRRAGGRGREHRNAHLRAGRYAMSSSPAATPAIFRSFTRRRLTPRRYSRGCAAAASATRRI